MTIADLRLPICDCRMGDARPSRLAALLTGRWARLSTHARSHPASGAVKQQGRGTVYLRSPAARGFTLAELIVVMGVIVLLITLAVPAIRALTGTKSEEAARNTLSAFLGRVRTEAIGLQQTQGCLFFIDQAADRVACLQVQAAPPLTGNSSPDRPGVIYLDAVPDRDPLYLPAGVRLQTLKDVSTSVYPRDRYLGYNQLPNTKNNPATNKPTLVGGLILFDGTGRTISVPYGFRLSVTGRGGQATAMGQLVNGLQDCTTAPNGALNSQIGFVLFDRDAFTTASGTDLDAQTDEAKEEQWLDNNATPILLNRYDGTLIRAE